MEVFKWIIETSLAASIIALIIICIRAIVIKKLSPTIIYYMWFIVIIKLFMPNGPESSFSVYNLFHKSEAQIVQNTNNINNLASGTNIKGLEDTSGARSTNENYSKSTNSVQTNKENFILKNEYTKAVTGEVESTNYLNIYYVLFSIWIIGMGIILGKSIQSYIVLMNRVKGNKSDNMNLELLLNETMNELSINQKVKIITLENFQSPTLFGVINPKIIIPKYVLENSSTKELKYILLHELVHLKRKDNIVIWVLLLTKIAHWFNPFILFAINLMQRDCELSCDYNVLKKIERVENIDYGMTILNVIKSFNSEKQYIGTTTLVRNKKEIKERITMISRNKKYGFTTLIVGVILIGVLAVSGLTSKNYGGYNNTPDLASAEVDNIKEDTSEYTNLGDTNSSIVVYSSHNKEDYSNGLTVSDADKILVSKLNENGLDAMYLKNTKEVDYNDSYRASRELIIENIDNYENKMLIDIHRPAKWSKDTEKTKNIFLELSKSSSKFEENQLFADKLKNELEQQGIVVKIKVYENGILNFNADLAANSILLEVGSGASTKEDLEFCMNKLSQAIKNIN